MLAEPSFVEAQVVEVLHQIQIALYCQRGILVHWVERREKYACAQAA